MLYQTCLPLHNFTSLTFAGRGVEGAQKAQGLHARPVRPQELDVPWVGADAKRGAHGKWSAWEADAIVATDLADANAISFIVGT